MPITKKPAEKIRVGETVGFPGDRACPIEWAVIEKIEHDPEYPNIVTFRYTTCYPHPYIKGKFREGVYFARRSDSLKVK